MVRLIVLFSLFVAVASDGLSTVSKRKTYADGQVFTAADYNADIDESVNWVNDLNVKFPGTSPQDSVKTNIAAHDTIVALDNTSVTFKSALRSNDSSDSLVFDWAHVDTLWIGVATAPIENFSGGTTAGVRLNFGSLVRADSVWAGTTTPVAGFTGGASAGARFTFGSLVAIDSLRVRDSLQVSPGARAYLPRLRTDTLLVGSATATVGFTHGFSPAGARTTFASLVAIDSLRVRDSLQVSPGARAMIPRARIDTLLIGSATALAGYSDAASAGQRSFRAYARIDTTITDTLYAVAPRFEDVHLAAGGVIYINGTDITATAATNTMTWAGATSGYVFNDGPMVFGGTNPILRANTSDGADNAIMQIAGGGTSSRARGASLTLTGNEYASPGLVQIQAGEVSGGVITFLTGANLERVRIGEGGAVFINETANANMTIGLTINQGANDDQALALKSADVATGLTSATTTAVETDDWLTVSKNSVTAGGARIQSLGETAGNTVTTVFSGGGSASPTKSTAGRSLLELSVSEHDGGNALRNLTQDGNAIGFRGRRGGSEVTLGLFDEDGDLYATTAAQTFDIHADVDVLSAYEYVRSKGNIIRTEFEDFARYNEADLIAMDILGAPVDEGGLTNVTQLQRFHNGAIRENARSIRANIEWDYLQAEQLGEHENRLWTMNEILDSLRTENVALRQRVASLESVGGQTQPLIFRSN